MKTDSELLSYCAIIGDVHADASRLEDLLGHPELLGRPKLFLGDLLTRGPEAKKTLDLIVSLGSNATAVMGNHERLFLQFYDDGAFVPFAAAGGIETIRSYVGVAHGNVHAQFQSVFPLAHLNFIRDMRPFIETPDLLVSHAGLDPSNQESRTFESISMGHPEIFQYDKKLMKRVVCGHYVQERGQPFLGTNLVCLDTGCGTINGPLTALLLPEWRTVMTHP